jgi:hypothetical protein
MQQLITTLMPILIPLALVLVLVIVFGGKSNSTQSHILKVPERIPEYRKRLSIMNGSERAFFFELKKQLPPNYYIFPNMRIADIVDAIDGRGFYNRRNKILPKHIDFLICDSYFKPVVAIEINGSSHNRADRVERDMLVNQIFKDAQLPLKTIGVGDNFIESVQQIKSYLIT